MGNYLIHKFIFQSTPSAWRETVMTSATKRKRLYFNPLPPHGGRHIPDAEDTKQNHFHPLPPHGGRPRHNHGGTDDRIFQSTPSAWRETDQPLSRDTHQPISIHSLRMEGDVVSVAVSGKPLYFNPLPPHGGRQKTSRHPARESHFNPLPPHGGRPTRLL